MNPISSNSLYMLIRIVAIVLPGLLLWLFMGWARKSGGRTLRPIPAFDAVKGLLGRMAESGRRVHIALGTSGVGDAQMPILACGLAVLRHLARQGASFGASPLTTVADPTSMLLAQDIVYDAYKSRGLQDHYQATDVQMIAPDAAAYAVGVQDAVNRETVAANVMIGHFDQEYLLMGEAGAQRGLIQLAGSDTVDAQPFMLATSRNVLIGEEAFAAGAYLTQEPKYVASLRVQDVLRVLIVLAIVLGVLWETLGPR
ncbi:MAG: hypothetical protein JW934_01030 [Anaerolineae bacterium]|nr:hypothetical protein [Anaerolineae bacterium]